MSDLQHMLEKKTSWTPATSAAKLVDGERCRIPWPRKDALLKGGTAALDWREGIVHLETKHIRLDGCSVPFPKEISAIQVLR